MWHSRRSRDETAAAGRRLGKVGTCKVRVRRYLTVFPCLTCDLLVIKTQIYLEHGSSQLVTMECLGGIVTASGWRRWEILEVGIGRNRGYHTYVTYYLGYLV